MSDIGERLVAVEVGLKNLDDHCHENFELIRGDIKSLDAEFKAAIMSGAAHPLPTDSTQMYEMIPERNPTWRQIFWKWGPWAMIAASILIATISYCKYTGVI